MGVASVWEKNDKFFPRSNKRSHIDTLSKRLLFSQAHRKKAEGKEADPDLKRGATDLRNSCRLCKKGGGGVRVDSDGKLIPRSREERRSGGG